jgi:hypothetical protein
MDRTGALAHIGGGGLFMAGGTVVLLYGLGHIFTDQPTDHPVATSMVGLLGILPGACLVILGLRMLGPPQSSEQKERDFIVTGCAISLIVITLMGLILTAVALFAWEPDEERRFSGGFTGSIWEHRIAWGLIAAALDAVALVVWGLLAYQAVRWLLGRR